MLRSVLLQAGQAVGVAVRASLAVLERVLEHGKKLEPPLDSGIKVRHFIFDIQCRVVGEYAEIDSPTVASEAFESPNNAPSLQIEKSPMYVSPSHA